MSVYIYPDSHAVFDDLKAVMFEAGIRYGTEFVEDDRSLMFGEGGAGASGSLRDDGESLCFRRIFSAPDPRCGPCGLPLTGRFATPLGDTMPKPGRIDDVGFEGGRILPAWRIGGGQLVDRPLVRDFPDLAPGLAVRVDPGHRLGPVAPPVVFRLDVSPDVACGDPLVKLREQAARTGLVAVDDVASEGGALPCQLEIQ